MSSKSENMVVMLESTVLELELECFLKVGIPERDYGMEGAFVY